MRTDYRDESASQFSREYSRFFGQPPMRDIRSLRSSDALPMEPEQNSRQTARPQVWAREDIERG
jgi:hypothetical protein